MKLTNYLKWRIRTRSRIQFVEIFKSLFRFIKNPMYYLKKTFRYKGFDLWSLPFDLQFQTLLRMKEIEKDCPFLFHHEETSLTEAETLDTIRKIRFHLFMKLFVSSGSYFNDYYFQSIPEIRFYEKRLCRKFPELDDLIKLLFKEAIYNNDNYKYELRMDMESKESYRVLFSYIDRFSGIVYSDEEFKKLGFKSLDKIIEEWREEKLSYKEGEKLLRMYLDELGV